MLCASRERDAERVIWRAKAASEIATRALMPRGARRRYTRSSARECYY